MGSSGSKQRLGERVQAAQMKMEHDLKTHQQRYEALKAQPNADKVMSVIHDTVRDSFAQRAAFLDSTLLVAWMDDGDRCKKVIVETLEDVFTAPIEEKEFAWFRHYVLPSTILFMQSKTAPSGQKHLYQELMRIVATKSKNKVESMDRIYKHLAQHEDWGQVMEIGNETRISRQDDERVGLLREDGLKQVFEAEAKDEEEAKKQEDLKSYIDSNVCVNALTATASTIDAEFQQYMKRVLGQHGEVEPGPTKKVERSQSKLENDYAAEGFPKSAKLLDLTRCSVTFNTVDQMVGGFKALKQHVLEEKNQKHIELARVKNGFLDAADGGYRDIKMNVLFKSEKHPGLHMVCEVQLLLINYLMEKKKMHRLYSVEREKLFFDGVAVGAAEKEKEKQRKEIKLNTLIHNVEDEVELKLKNCQYMHKCSMDSELGLLAMEEGYISQWFGVVDIATKKAVFERKRSEFLNNKHSHQWLSIDGQKYLSIQTSGTELVMFKVSREQNEFVFTEDPKYSLKHSQIIFLSDFSFDFKDLVLLTQDSVLEKRRVEDIQTVTQRIELKDKVTYSAFRAMRLSADGTLCAVGGGDKASFFYVIDMESTEQHKFESTTLTSTYVPCFINGGNALVAVGDDKGRIEVWNIATKQCVKTLYVQGSPKISASASIHDVYAVSSWDQKLRLFDVNSWECVYVQKFTASGESLHLTHDLKYVTFAGWGKSKGCCAVLKIQ